MRKKTLYYLTKFLIQYKTHVKGKKEYIRMYNWKNIFPLPTKKTAENVTYTFFFVRKWRVEMQ